MIRRKDAFLLTQVLELDLSHFLDERHFWVVFDEMVAEEWAEGLRLLFSSDRTKEMYNSFYPSERMHWFEDLIHHHLGPWLLGESGEPPTDEEGIQASIEKLDEAV